MAKRPALVGVVVVGCLVAGCAGLPAAGPLASDIVDQAGTPTEAQLTYILLDVTEPVSRTLADRPTASFLREFGDEEPPRPTVGIGDALSVTVWESGPSGLFSSAVSPGQVIPTSRGAVISDLVVDRDGRVTIPYAGRVPVSGLEPAEVERLITNELEGKTVEPQVLVAVVRNISNSVTVSGEVASSARIPLSVRGDRILDVIASAGGVRIPVVDALVQLTRGHRTVSLPYEFLLNNPDENVYLHGNDILTIIREPQSFTVFGASLINAQVPFQTRVVTLQEAIAKVGGLNDLRADPTGVFVFRHEEPAVLRELAPSQDMVGETMPVPVAYRFNLQDAASYFLAQQFVVRDKDMIYVANARLNEVQKFLTLIGAALTPAATSAALATSISAANR